MRWFTKHLRNVGIACVSVLFLLTCLALIPLSAASAHEGTSGVATPTTVTVQSTPTVDTTVTALNKEQLVQEVQQLKNQNDRSLSAWLWNSSSLLGSLVAALLAVAGVLWTTKVAQDKNLVDSQAERTRRDEEQKRWLKNQEAEREKRAEERFQAVVTGLGDDKEGAKIGAAILLRTFLRPGYEQFYTQTFDLAVANLRLPRTSNSPEDPDDPILLTPIRQALIVAFQEAFPLARDLHAKADYQPTHKYGRSLNASNLPLDNADLRHADLRKIWMPGASLRNANLSGAYLEKACLIGADLRKADFFEADLSNTDLSGTDLRGVEYLEKALSLKDTKLLGVKGLTQRKLEAYQKLGAIIKKPATSTPSTAASSPSSPGNASQPSSAPSAQGSIPPSDPDGSSNTSSQQEPKA